MVEWDVYGCAFVSIFSDVSSGVLRTFMVSVVTCKIKQLPEIRQLPLSIEDVYG